MRPQKRKVFKDGEQFITLRELLLLNMQGEKIKLIIKEAIAENDAELKIKVILFNKYHY